MEQTHCRGTRRANFESHIWERRVSSMTHLPQLLQGFSKAYTRKNPRWICTCLHARGPVYTRTFCFGCTAELTFFRICKTDRPTAAPFTHAAQLQQCFLCDSEPRLENLPSRQTSFIEQRNICVAMIQKTFMNKDCTEISIPGVCGSIQSAPNNHNIRWYGFPSIKH